MALNYRRLYLVVCCTGRTMSNTFAMRKNNTPKRSGKGRTRFKTRFRCVAFLSAESPSPPRARSESGSNTVRLGFSETGCPNHVNWAINPNEAKVSQTERSARILEMIKKLVLDRGHLGRAPRPPHAYFSFAGLDMSPSERTIRFQAECSPPPLSTRTSSVR